MTRRLSRGRNEETAESEQPQEIQQIVKALGDIRRITENNGNELAELRALLTHHTEKSSCTLARDADNGDQRHNEVLTLAAGIANARLLCHADTWAFISERASTGEHFRMSTDIKVTEENTVDAGLSGRTLIAVADSLWRVARSAETPQTTLRLAARAYDRIATALAQVDAAGTGDPVRIVIDDRRPAVTEQDGTAA